MHGNHINETLLQWPKEEGCFNTFSLLLPLFAWDDSEPFICSGWYNLSGLPPFIITGIGHMQNVTEMETESSSRQTAVFQWVVVEQCSVNTHYKHNTASQTMKKTLQLQANNISHIGMIGTLFSTRVSVYLTWGICFNTFLSIPHIGTDVLVYLLLGICFNTFLTSHKDSSSLLFSDFLNLYSSTYVLEVLESWLQIGCILMSQ